MFCLLDNRLSSVAAAAAAEAEQIWLESLEALAIQSWRFVVLLLQLPTQCVRVCVQVRTQVPDFNKRQVLSCVAFVFC